MFSVVVPVYKNEGSLGDLLEALRGISAQLSSPMEAVFVVDGSPDQSFSSLASSLPRMPFDSQLIGLSRNFGSFAAIRVGLERARGSFFAVMAADLQEPPELIGQSFAVLARDEADVVVGTRISRDDPFFSKTASKLFWSVYRRVVQRGMPAGGLDVFACNRLFRDELLKLEESNSSLVGLLIWLGFRRAEIPYERRRRQHGTSGWTFLRKLKYLTDSAFSFSSLPIQLLLWMGFVGLLISVTFSIIVVWARMSGRIQVPGYAPVILTTTFFGSLHLICLGLVGSYVWRAFENTKRRPMAVVMREMTFKRG